jgi:hypothetical protein
MSETQTEPTAAEPEKPVLCTLELEVDEHGLGLGVLAKTLTAWEKGLASVEREITKARRARIRWRITELSFDGKTATITIEEPRH